MLWHAPPECPQQTEFALRVERLLGQTLDARRAQNLEISGDVQASAELGYVVHLRVHTDGGMQARELSHRDCAELTEAAALVTALAIDPELVVPDDAKQAEPPSEPAAASEPVAAPPAATPAPKPAAPPPPASLGAADTRASDRLPRAPERPFRIDVAVLGLVGNSVLPDIGGGVGARARLGRGRFGLAVAGEYWLTRSRALDGSSVQNVPGIELGAWGVGAEACGAPLVGRLTMSVCAGPLLGDAYGSGNALLTNPRTSHQRWSALMAEANVVVATPAFGSLWLGLEVGKTLETPRFGIVEDGQPSAVFQPSGWLLSGLAGIGFFR
jgi:hypothetical protein